MSNKELDDAVTDVVKKKRTRPDRTEALIPHTEPGEISKMLTQAMVISHWPQIDTNDAEQVQARIDEYHMFCIQNDIKPDMPGLALSLGVTRKTVWAWENGFESNKPVAVRNAIKKGRQINELLLTQMMANGKINPVAGIFFLKNSHDYHDQQEVVVSPQTPVTNVDPEQARKRIMDAIPVDPIEGQE